MFLFHKTSEGMQYQNGFNYGSLHSKFRLIFFLALYKLKIAIKIKILQFHYSNLFGKLKLKTEFDFAKWTTDSSLLSYSPYWKSYFQKYFSITINIAKFIKIINRLKYGKRI